jgi:hypothetical protein
MKSFRKFINEGRKEFLEKQKIDVEAARKKLAQTPVLSDDEMRAQNPEATAAYEKEVARKKAKVKAIKTPESIIITNMPKGSTTPEEIISRLEIKSKPKKSIKTRIVKTPVKTQTTSISQSTSTTPKSLPAPVSTLSKPKVTSSNRTQAWQGPTKLSTSVEKVSAASRTQSSADALKDILKTNQAAKSAQRAAFASSAKKTLGNLGKTAGIIGAGLEAKTGYDTARSAGASKKTAAGVAALKSAGALAGGALGGAVGGVLGIPGAIGGSVAGYTLGSKAGEAAAKAIRGDYGKKLTTKDVLSNVRKTVPYEIRKQIPSEVRKSYRDFVAQAGKVYGNWQKSQQGGNK